MSILVDETTTGQLAVPDPKDPPHPWRKQATIRARYERAYPWQITVTVLDQDYPLARDDLDAALTTGRGRARPRPRSAIALDLELDSTALQLRVPARWLRRLLHTTHQLVPPGEEISDAELAALTPRRPPQP